MRDKVKLVLCDFTPLPLGLLLVKMTALLLSTDLTPLIETLLDLLEQLPVLFFWFVVWLGFDSKRTVPRTTEAMALFLLPAVLFALLPGKLPSYFLYPLRTDLTGIPHTQWQICLLAILKLGFAFWIGRRLPNLSDVNDYYQYGLLRMALGLVRYYYSHLSNDHGTADTMLLDPFFVIAGLPLVWLQFKAGWNILRSLFHRLKS